MNAEQARDPLLSDRRMSLPQAYDAFLARVARRVDTTAGRSAGIGVPAYDAFISRVGAGTVPIGGWDAVLRHGQMENSTSVESSGELGAPLARLLHVWLAQREWFAGKGRPIGTVTILATTPLITGEDPLLDHVLFEVNFTDRSPVHRYQLFLARTRDPVEPDQFVLGTIDGWTVFDGLWNQLITNWIEQAIRENRTFGGLEFCPEPGVDNSFSWSVQVADASPESDRPNRSALRNDTSTLDLYRRVLPGRNTELEVQRALRQMNSRAVVGVQGTITGTLDGAPVTLGILHDRVQDPRNGWATALRKAQSKDDFTHEAWQMGGALAGVHDELRRARGESTRSAGDQAAIWHEHLTTALRDARGEARELFRYEARIRDLYDIIAVSDVPIPVQRVHGNLHLAQNLQASDGWLLIDFEGVPGASEVERTRPDSVLRDVASMLRSFDYAGLHGIAADWGQWGKPVTLPNRRRRQEARRWADDHGSSFCLGYAEETGNDPRSWLTLLRAYELDRAVHEVTFETRVREGWVAIPLVTVAHLALAPMTWRDQRLAEGGGRSGVQAGRGRPSTRPRQGRTPAPGGGSPHPPARDG